MSDNYTPADHDRLANLVIEFLNQPEILELEDAEFCLFATNIMLNAVMRVSAPMRLRMLAQMMGVVRKSVTEMN